MFAVSFVCDYNPIIPLWRAETRPASKNEHKTKAVFDMAMIIFFYIMHLNMIIYKLRRIQELNKSVVPSIPNIMLLCANPQIPIFSAVRKILTYKNLAYSQRSESSRDSVSTITYPHRHATNAIPYRHWGRK